MFKALFDVFFKVIIGLVNLVLSPINLLVATAFPDFTILITTFTNALNTYVLPGFNWFFSILPPNFRSLALLYFSLLVSFYTVVISVHAILKVYTIIKQIKIW